MNTAAITPREVVVFIRPPYVCSKTQKVSRPLGTCNGVATMPFNWTDEVTESGHHFRCRPQFGLPSCITRHTIHAADGSILICWYRSSVQMKKASAIDRLAREWLKARRELLAAEKEFTGATERSRRPPQSGPVIDSPPRIRRRSRGRRRARFTVRVRGWTVGRGYARDLHVQWPLGDAVRRSPEPRRDVPGIGHDHRPHGAADLLFRALRR